MRRLRFMRYSSSDSRRGRPRRRVDRWRLLRASGRIGARAQPAQAGGDANIPEADSRSPPTAIGHLASSPGNRSRGTRLAAGAQSAARRAPGVKRRNFLVVTGAAALGVAGCGVDLSGGVLNACAAQLPERLRADPLVTGAWTGLDPAKVWDVHCHVFGSGDSGSDLWFNPALEQIWQPQGYLQRLFYLNASCAHDAPGRVDESIVDRLLNQIDAMPAGYLTLLFAFDWARDEAGRPNREHATFHVPDEYCAGLAQRFPRHFVWAASIHPYDPAALDRLDAAAARGARAVKWLPSAQNIDPASARCDRFYARLAETRLPLISHGGDERAVRGHDETLGNPLRLRRALDAGVRVVVAHCASLGMGADLDRGGTQMVPNFELFARLMDDPRYARNVAGDISAVTQGNRVDVVAALLARRDWHARLLNGSDYPLPGVLPLVSLPALVERRLLDPAAAPLLREIRDHNVLLFDFVLKRSLASDGAGFAREVFETRPYFDNAL
jgi:mannonate dehydratase